MLNHRLARVVLGIAFTTLSITCTHAHAQVYYIPFQIPSHPEVVLDGFGPFLAAGDGYVFASSAGSVFNERNEAVYQFNRNTFQYIRTYNPVSEPEGDLFGFNLDYHDGDLVVAAPSATTSFGQENGEAYRFNADTGALLHTYGEPGGFGFFGYGLTFDGINTIIGEPGGFFSGLGQIYVYRAFDNSLVTTFGPDPLTNDSDYGDSLELNLSYLAVSAPSSIDVGAEGAVYIYEYGTAALLYRLTSPIVDPEVGRAEFGSQIALSGNKLLVGYDFSAADAFKEKVHVYDLTTGNLITTLTNNTGALDDGFGNSMSAEGNIAVLGAFRDDDMGSNAGAVYIYDLETYQLIDKVYAPLPRSNHSAFGRTSRIQNGTILASSFLLSTPEPNDRVIHILEQFCRADINLDGVTDFFDISDFIKVGIDFNGDGRFDFFDISAFLTSYQTPCP